MRPFGSLVCVLAIAAALSVASGCSPSGGEGSEGAVADDPFAAARRYMVDDQIRARGVKDALVLDAMRRVPRHLFVPPELTGIAYTDGPLPIGLDQTISQPYIVALMTELAELEGGETVLEIGTGSGYQAAILSEIAGTVYTIEIVEPLATTAAARLDSLGYTNVVVRCGDGYQGWAEHSPFDAIIVTAAPDHVPEPLVQQLRVGGRLVIPVGDIYQELLQITKTEHGALQRRVIPVRFVPMTGEAERQSRGEAGR